jgi:integrase
MTGMREQKGMCTYWSDVNFAAATVRVSHKPDRGWTPKAYKEREIPIPTRLVKSLKGWTARPDKACGLVFPTAGCNPKLDFLDCLKAVAERAKLDQVISGFTRCVQRSRRDVCGLASICARCSSGWDIPTWNRQCGI